MNKDPGIEQQFPQILLTGMKKLEIDPSLGSNNTPVDDRSNQEITGRAPDRKQDVSQRAGTHPAGMTPPCPNDRKAEEH